MNMKSISLVVLFLAVFGIIAFVFRSYSPTKSDVTEQSEQNIVVSQEGESKGEITDLASFNNGQYVISPADSSVVWIGSKKLIANYEDEGILPISLGYVDVNEGLVTGGDIMLDMSNLTVTRVAKNSESGLEKHLKSDDFFAVEKFPTANIKLVKAEKLDQVEGSEDNYNLEVEMTIKDVTQTLTIPAQIYSQDGQLIITGKADLDRTLWDIRYGSDKFFDNLADNVINDIFTVDFRFVGAIK